MNESADKSCDECGRSVLKIHRVYKGHRYCTTCYARVFKQRVCPGCKALKRLPSNDPDAICSACESSKPCVRCERIGLPVGRITAYGPVCNSCSPYFRAVEPCEGCGKPSSHLSRITRLGNNLRLCPQCQRSDYRTCPDCRRHRLLIAVGDDGKEICSACKERGEIPCESCGKPMPGGRITRCEDCYWIETARKRLYIDQQTFSSPSMADAFGRFGEWLISKCSAKSAALSLSRYLSFFREIERVWGTFPSYPVLVNHFKPEGLRRVRRPMRWLCEKNACLINPDIRESTSEENRIANMLATFPPSVVAGQALGSYENQLRVRQQKGKTSVRSIRLALTPAVKLLLASNIAGKALPDQSTLDGYLVAYPGQQAAITGFINYLKSAFDLELTPRVDMRKATESRKKKLEEKLLRLLRDDGLVEVAMLEQWVPVAMEYFHDMRLPKRLLGSALSSMVSSDHTGIALTINNKEYYLPLPDRGYNKIHSIEAHDNSRKIS